MEEEQMITRTIDRGSASGVAGVSLLVALGMTSAALADADPITAQPLSERHVFTDDLAMQLTLSVDGSGDTVIELDDASNIAVVEITIQPGAMFPWHIHPGPAFASVTEGELVYVYAADCVERPYPAGTAFLDPGFDNVHTAFNPSDTDPAVVIATFFGAPDEGELTIPVDAEEAAALDAECGIER